MKLRAAIVLLLIPILAGCTSLSGLPSTSGAAAPASASARGATTLTIYGAASLKAVLAAIETAYEAGHSGTSLTISTDSSSALEAKIEQGAPADVFLAADTTNPQKLVAAGLAPGGVTKFAGNLLTVVVPGANPAGIQSPVDLARPGLKIVAAGDAVPITKYATQLVANLARQPGYPADFAAAYTRNVVSKEDNAAAVVAKVELGEGDAGIVYVTDAKTSTKVATIPMPSTANVLATYGAVVVGPSPNRDAAETFLAWLTGAEGQAILGSFGFLPAD